MPSVSHYFFLLYTKGNIFSLENGVQDERTKLLRDYYELLLFLLLIYTIKMVM